MVGFSIEVPGEAVPLSQAAVEQTLRAASSRNPTQIQAGTKQLQNWSTQKGFYPLLQDAFLNRASLPTEIRMLAIIQLKNGIDKHWRRAAINAVSLTEREQIKERLLGGTLDEPNDRLAEMSSIVAAKIARYEFPAHWRNLMEDLNALLQQCAAPQTPPLRLLRALNLTHHTVKELATIKLTVQRTAFQAAIPDLFETLKNLYYFHLQQWQSAISGDLNPHTVQLMNVTERTLKVIRRLVVAGFSFPHRDGKMHLQEHLQNAYRISATAHAKQLAKMHVSMAKEHGTSFALLPNTPDLVRTYWTTAKEFRRQQMSAGEEIDDDQVHVYNEFNLRAVLILRGCFREASSVGQSFRYRNEEGKEEPSRARKLLNEQLLTEDFIKELFEAVVTNFFFYVQTDIEEWINEPEEWDMKEDGDEESFEKSLRSAAERLFLDITLHHKDLVIQPLLETVRTIAASPSAQPLLKDAVYSALAIAAPILHNKFDFNSFLTTHLNHDLQNRNPDFSVVRRRIATLLARWIPIDIPDPNRPLVYQMYDTMLDANDPVNNLSVRITAAKRLRDVVDEMTFKPEVFQPYVPSITSRLLDLIREVSLSETKLAVLSTISTIVKRMTEEVIPFAEQIVAILQTLWDESGSENLMKVAIVTILRKLVEAMGRASTTLHSTVLPIIVATVTPGSELQVYLSEAALDLWIAVLERTTTATDDILGMIQYLPPFLRDEDHVRKALKITRSYVLLTPQRMLHDNVRDLLFSYLTTLLDMKTSSTVDTACNAIELMIRAAEGIGGDQAVQVVVQSLVSSGFSPRIFNSINQSWLHNDTSGPNKAPAPRDWKNRTNYLLVSSRVIISSTTGFLYMVQSYAESAMMTNEAVLQRFLEEAFRHMDAIGQPGETKLICMALTKLLETGQPWILEKLQDLMSLWTSMVTELQDGDKDTDSLVYTPPTVREVTENPESDRSTAVMYADPVHSINLGHFIRFHLQNAIQQLGGEQQFQEAWLVNVDKDIVKAFGELGIM